jgi:hypothetical protein
MIILLIVVPLLIWFIGGRLFVWWLTRALDPDRHKRKPYP